MPRLSETAFNSLLRQELVRVCPKWQFTSGAEQTRVFVNRAKQPDLTIRTHGGNTVIVESEFTPARTVEHDARKRFGETVLANEEAVETVVALRIPSHLASVSGDIAQEIRNTPFEYCVFNRIDEEIKRWPEDGWLSGNLRELADCLDLVSISEKQLADGTNAFELVVYQVANMIEHAVFVGPQIGRNIAKILHQEPGIQTYRMVATILTNAVVYHDLLSKHFELEDLDRTIERHDPERKLLAEWRHVIKDINFFPIFHLAIEMLITLGSKLGDRVSRRIIKAAQELAKVGVTTLYDLSGRMFQKLIVDRKFLATFYTLPSSSALLAEVALSMLPTNLHDPGEFRNLRIADLACGTGTLLAAAYRGILKRYEFLGFDSADVHSDLLSKSVYAADIMPAAAHMAASQLSSFHPHVKLVRSLVYTVPYGEQPSESGREIALGSLDLLGGANVSGLFGMGSQSSVPSLRESIDKELSMPPESLDLVIMNPPFTSPTNHKITNVPVPSFAGFSTTEAEQTEMAAKLKRIYKNVENRVGNGNAGLASNFCDLAHLKLKKGGVLALVLPIAAVSGASWKGLREMLSEQYTEVTVITISAQKSDDRSFSADTGMAECLIIGQKKQSDQPTSKEWYYVSLQQRPATILEATQTANAIVSKKNGEYGSLKLGNTTIGQFTPGSAEDSGLVSTHSLELGIFLRKLASLESLTIRGKDSLTLNLVHLDELGSRGFVDRDVGVTNMKAKNHRGAFEIFRGIFKSAMYPCLWWHDHSREVQIVIQPDSKGQTIAGREEKASRIWATSSRLHISRDFNTNSAAIVVCLTPERSLGGRAWPTFQCTDPNWEKVLALWGNSTLGLMLLWWLGSKQHSGRSINTVTKLPSLLVLDPRKLTNEQLEMCEEAYQKFSKMKLLPASSAYQDENRIALDSFVLGELCGATEEWQQDFETVRKLWCLEPIVGGRTHRE